MIYMKDKTIFAQQFVLIIYLEYSDFRQTV